MTNPQGQSFGELKDLCSLTDGNLNRHLLVLEEARLVAVSKSFEGARLLTRCRVTPLGRKRYIEYLSVLEQVIVDGSLTAKPDAKPGVDTPASAQSTPANG
jgi:DNA-binding transcriptional ArsR family regulator